MIDMACDAPVSATSTASAEISRGDEYVSTHFTRRIYRGVRQSVRYGAAPSV